MFFLLFQLHFQLLQLVIDGKEIDFLYDTGAVSTCMTLQSFREHFGDRSLLPRDGALVATGGYDLNLVGYFNAATGIPGKSTVIHAIDVCEKVNDNLMGIDLIHRVGLSFRASTNTLFAVTEDKHEWLASRQDLIFKPQSVTIATLRLVKNPEEVTKTRQVIALVENNSWISLTGGPALATSQPGGLCTMAIINNAPYEVRCHRGVPLARLEDLKEEPQVAMMSQQEPEVEESLEHLEQILIS